MGDFEVRVISNRSEPDLMIEMHKLRYRVFKQRLDWEVAVSGGMEIDIYDIEDPVYLGLIGPGERLFGAARFLPTTGPNMLADTFPMLLHGQPMPRGETIWDCSRLCIDTEASAAIAEGGLRRATHVLIAGIAAWGHARGITKLVAATDLHVERILRRAGCRVERLGPPIVIGKVPSVGCSFEVSARAVAETRAAGGITSGLVVHDGLAETPRKRA